MLLQLSSGQSERIHSHHISDKAASIPRRCCNLVKALYLYSVHNYKLAFEYCPQGIVHWSCHTHIAYVPHLPLDIS